MTENEYSADYGWMQYQRTRLKYLEGKIQEITATHPLQEMERSVLADMIMNVQEDGMVEITPEKAKAQYQSVIGWLESTGRISPREWMELKKLPDQEAKA